jgi:hypothetical protein
MAIEASHRAGGLKVARVARVEREADKLVVEAFRADKRVDIAEGRIDEGRLMLLYPRARPAVATERKWRVVRDSMVLKAN